LTNISFSSNTQGERCDFPVYLRGLLELVQWGRAMTESDIYQEFADFAMDWIGAEMADPVARSQNVIHEPAAAAVSPTEGLEEANEDE
jgi:hypothetical protein